MKYFESFVALLRIIFGVLFSSKLAEKNLQLGGVTRDAKLPISKEKFDQILSWETEEVCHKIIALRAAVFSHSYILNFFSLLQLFGTVVYDTITNSISQVETTVSEV